MIRKILLGYDGSPSATDAFTFALDLAMRYQAHLHVIAVSRPSELAEDMETDAILENSRRHYEKVLKPLQAHVATKKLKAQFEIVVGHPAEQLVRYAEGHGIDHIVVGHRGRTLFERWLIGSVARQVVAYAHCAVTVVRT